MRSRRREYDTSAFYTLILYNTAPKSPAVAAARIADDYSSVTQTTSAYYRFFNLSPDAPGVDLYLNSTVAQTNRSPMDNLTNLSYDEFQPINPGTFSVNVKKANTDTVLASINTDGTDAKHGLHDLSVWNVFESGCQCSDCDLLTRRQAELVPVGVFLDWWVVGVRIVIPAAASPSISAQMHAVHAKAAATAIMVLIAGDSLAGRRIEDHPDAKRLLWIPGAEISAQDIHDGNDGFIDEKTVVVAELNGYPDRAFGITRRELAVLDSRRIRWSRRSRTAAAALVSSCCRSG